VLILLGCVLPNVWFQHHFDILELVREFRFKEFFSNFLLFRYPPFPDELLLLFFKHIAMPSVKADPVENLPHERIDRRFG
jgi:hypothetical protein